MQRLAAKYAAKLEQAGLVEPGGALVGGLDDELAWNRADPRTALFEEVFAGLNINSLVFARPAEPYRTVIDYLAAQAPVIEPADCETRTFLHDLPVIPELTSAGVVATLKARKSVIIPGQGIVTFGTVSPEQGFVTMSSVCFASFVKFFSDYLADARAQRITPAQREAFERAVAHLPAPHATPPSLMPGPFEDEGTVHAALCEAGRHTVGYRLVDSYFGNISYRLADTLYISQTGSSLDEMQGCIDPCPLEGGSTAGLTASSELSAHMDVIRRTGKHAILHGHPKFAVILSMDCQKKDCPNAHKCHVGCTEKRFVGDIPIVPGEVGTGPTGLCHTLPPVLENTRGAIVYGHGLFTVGEKDFTDAFAALLDVENMCRERYFELVQAAA